MPGLNYCPQCGSKLELGSNYCAKCGTSQNIETRIIKKSNKSALAALLLCLFLGALGIHRFYVGKIGTGILMLLTAGGFGIWTLIDLIRIACGDFTDSDGNYLELVKGSTSSTKKVLLIIGLVFTSIIIFVLCIIMLAFYVTSGMTETVQGQLAALRAGDYTKAYSYTSKDFQRMTPFDEFKKFVDNYPALKNNKNSTFTHREVENNEGTVSGTLESTNGTTTPVKYRLIKENNHWKIIYILISPSGADVNKNTNQNATPTQEKSSSANEIKLPNIFKSKGGKYSINYPTKWKYIKPDKATVVFGEKKGVAAFDSTVNIQVILTKQSGGYYNNQKELMNSLKKQALKISPDTKIIAEKTINLMKTSNGMEMQGKYMVFTYVHKGKTIKQLQYIFHRNDDRNFYTWAYTSTVDRYDIDYPIAQAMFESWSVH